MLSFELETSSPVWHHHQRQRFAIHRAGLCCCCTQAKSLANICLLLDPHHRSHTSLVVSIKSVVLDMKQFASLSRSLILAGEAEAAAFRWSCPLWLLIQSSTSEMIFASQNSERRSWRWKVSMINDCFRANNSADCVHITLPLRTGSRWRADKLLCLVFGGQRLDRCQSLGWWF